MLAVAVKGNPLLPVAVNVSSHSHLKIQKRCIKNDKQMYILSTAVLGYLLTWYKQCLFLDII